MMVGQTLSACSGLCDGKYLTNKVNFHIVAMYKQKTLACIAYQRF